MMMPRVVAYSAASLYSPIETSRIVAQRSVPMLALHLIEGDVFVVMAAFRPWPPA